MTAQDLVPVLPEIFLAVMSMVLLLVGVFRGDGSTRFVGLLAVLTLLVTIALVAGMDKATTVTMNGLFIVDHFAAYAKILILLGAIFAVVMSMDYARHQGMNRFEFPVLIILATLGMLMMVSANDMMALYVGLELQSLALYVCAAIKRDTVRASEAGLKYFVLGALSSGMLLYGMSLVYGFAGSTDFAVLAERLSAGDPGLGLVVGMVFVLAGLAFKISAVPFHMWTPDVYEGAPTPVTAFFAVAPKVAALALFTRVLFGPFGPLVDQWQQVIIVISIGSMVLGAFAAIAQTNIKRLMAYSSIGHMGFALVGLAAGTEEGVRGVLIYLGIYLFMNVGTFAVILSMRRNNRMVESISDLAGLGRTQPGMAFALAIFMFSMAGIPPAAGFLGKFYVFVAAINAELYTLAVIGVLASVVGCFYYIRIVKVMYFEEPIEAFDRPAPRELSLITAVMAAVTALLIVYPGPIINTAQVAALSIMPPG